MKYFKEIEETDIQTCFEEIDGIKELILKENNKSFRNYLLECLTKRYEYLAHIYLGRE